MRKIKFRAWDKENNDMLEDVSTWTDDFTDMLNETLNYYSEFGNLELMQFTGLLDKNGKEIYEGDIVKEDDEIGFVKYGDGMFFAFSYAFEHSELLPKDLEVIGNIYKNSELLAVSI